MSETIEKDILKNHDNRLDSYLYKNDFLISLDSLLSLAGDSSHYAAQKIIQALLWSDKFRAALVEELKCNDGTGYREGKSFRVIDALREALVENLDWIGEQLVTDLLYDNARLESENKDLREHIAALNNQWPTGFEKYRPQMAQTIGYSSRIPDVLELIKLCEQARAVEEAQV